MPKIDIHNQMLFPQGSFPSVQIVFATLQYIKWTKLSKDRKGFEVKTFFCKLTYFPLILTQSQELGSMYLVQGNLLTTVSSGPKMVQPVNQNKPLVSQTPHHQLFIFQEISYLSMDFNILDRNPKIVSANVSTPNPSADLKF